MRQEGQRPPYCSPTEINVSRTPVTHFSGAVSVSPANKMLLIFRNSQTGGPQLSLEEIHRLFCSLGRSSPWRRDPESARLLSRPLTSLVDPPCFPNGLRSGPINFAGTSIPRRAGARCTGGAPHYRVAEAILRQRVRLVSVNTATPTVRSKVAVGSGTAVTLT
jgi:hypothetical protein